MSQNGCLALQWLRLAQKRGQGCQRGWWRQLQGKALHVSSCQMLGKDFCKKCGALSMFAAQETCLLWSQGTLWLWQQWLAQQRW